MDLYDNYLYGQSSKSKVKKKIKYMLCSKQNIIYNLCINVSVWFNSLILTTMMTATAQANEMAPLYGPSSSPRDFETKPIQPKNIKHAVPMSSAKNINKSFCHGGRPNNWLVCSVDPIKEEQI